MKIEQKEGSGGGRRRRKTTRKEPKKFAAAKVGRRKKSIKFLFLSAAHTLRVKTAYKIEDEGNNGTVKVCSTAVAAMEKKVKSDSTALRVVITSPRMTYGIDSGVLPTNLACCTYNTAHKATLTSKIYKVICSRAHNLGYI